MSDEPTTKTSFVASHSLYPRRPLAIAPTDGPAKFNAISIPLIPIACWRLSDPGFAFDSSFVSPAFRDEVAELGSHLQRYPDAVATLFGHCDPVGSDALNKILGDRRVIAIYALLTRQPDLWAQLYDNAQAGDTWDLHMVQTMLASVPDRDGTPYYAGDTNGKRDAATTAAVKRFQADTGLSTDGDPGPTTRKALFGAYMDWLCTPPAGPPNPSNDPSATPAASPPATLAPLLEPADFLGGKSAGRGDLPKMSLQSCGKFNPIVLLTKEEMGGAGTSDGAFKMQRNADDAPNRRVIMFLFEKGTIVDPGEWPCPKVKEGYDACKAEFWPDGDQRRQNGDTLRVYADTKDTMACRWYDRFARRSPCERPQPPVEGSPVYFCALVDDVPILNAPGASAKVIGKLEKGEVVRSVEEKYEDQAYFVRFERVDVGTAQTLRSYYRIRPKPRSEWICATRDGSHFAFWSTLDGTPLSLRAGTLDLDDRFAMVLADV
jgi:hypothetical protein